MLARRRFRTRFLQKPEAAANHAPHRFARLGIDREWSVGHALFQLETPFFRAGRLVNISRHGAKLNEGRGLSKPVSAARRDSVFMNEDQPRKNTVETHAPDRQEIEQLSEKEKEQLERGGEMEHQNGTEREQSAHEIGE